jgi:hypothetical protein
MTGAISAWTRVIQENELTARGEFAAHRCGSHVVQQCLEGAKVDEKDILSAA